ncbi:MAG: autotransporter domain-containing protein [Gammaproteobacteria bacterium]|nr:autotransporter domain-containing protein [Gammaproteobacteria bacterium]
MTASVAEGSLTAEQSFQVTVTNEPPEVADAYADATVRVTESVTVDLGPGFAKPVVAYSAEVEPTTASTVSVEGTGLTLTGLEAGPAVVTVVATNSGGSTDQSFGLTVRDIPPAVGEVLEPVSVRVGSTVEVDLFGAFSGTGLSYSGISSPDGMAAVSADGATLSVTGVASGSVTVAVSASNTEGSASQNLPVTVRDVAPAVADALEPISVNVGDVANVDLSNAFSGSGLTYTAVSSSEAMATASVEGSTLSVAGVGLGSVTVTVTATNTEGSASQDLAVTVEDQPPAAAEALADITLMVGDSMTVELSGAFTGTRLMYSAATSSDAVAVSVDGTSLMVTGVSAGSDTVTVTATNSAASADNSFTVTVRDVPPSVAGALPDMALVVGGAPGVVDLGQSFGGTGLVFSASTVDPAINVSVAGAHLTVSPMIEGVGRVSVTAGNTEGSVAASFSVTVSTSAAEADAIERGLAALGSATLSSVQSAFAARLRGPGAAIPVRRSGLAPAPGYAAGAEAVGFGSMQTGWSQQGWNPQGPTSWNGGGWDSGAWHGGMLADDWNDMSRRHPAGAGMSRPLSGTSFLLPLSASGGGGIGGFSLWGHADQQSFEGDGIDGDLTSVYVGTDMTIGDDWLVGVAASQSEGDVDYRFSSTAASGTGTLSTDMMTIFPYAKWDVDLCTDLWVILGFGSGDIESSRSLVGRTSEADLTMQLVSAGASRVVASGQDWSITLLGDVAALNMDTDGITGAITSLDVDVSRVRAAVEGKRTFAMDDGARVILFGQLGARSDSGDGDTGQGAEVSAGVRYNTAGRFSFEVAGRFLANHSEDDVEESAFSVSAMLRPRADGGGLSLGLSSRLGRDFDMTGMLQGVDYDYLRRMRGDRIDDWGFDARVGYGLSATGLPGVLTPFAKLDVASADRRGARIGARFDAGGNRVKFLSVEVSAGQAYHFYDDTMAGLVELRGELRF